MKTIRFLILAAVFPAGYPAAAAPPPCNDSAKVYKTCSSQQKIYDDALSAAAKERKLLLVEFGFETCPWCLSMSRIFGTPENSLKTAPFHIIQIEAVDRKLDGRKVLETLQKKDPATKTEGFPFLGLVNPRSGKAILLNTAKMEKNTASSKNHDPEKIFSALNEAAAKIR